jgi:hypothetical protein
MECRNADRQEAEEETEQDKGKQDPRRHLGKAVARPFRRTTILLLSSSSRKMLS